ncbi:MAG TPA: hypothetical protein VMW52_01490 [Phycisphaerae bacterium]|nr:hypothetical protein [Phycisphaerae bacterium]
MIERKPEVFVHLFHGRDDPDQDMDEWGEDGPLIGPFHGVHTTYRDHIKGVVDGDAVWTASIAPHEDMIFFRGKWYGDWCILDREGAKEQVLRSTGLVRLRELTPVEKHEACSRCREGFAGRGAIVQNPRTGEPMHEGCRVIEFGKEPKGSPLSKLCAAAETLLAAVEAYSSDISHVPDWCREEREALREALAGVHRG